MSRTIVIPCPDCGQKMATSRHQLAGAGSDMMVTLTCENRACLAAFEYSLKLLRHNFPCMLKVPPEQHQAIMELRSGSAALKPYLESLYPEER